MRLPTVARRSNLFKSSTQSATRDRRAPMLDVYSGVQRGASRWALSKRASDELVACETSECEHVASAERG